MWRCRRARPGSGPTFAVGDWARLAHSLPAHRQVFAVDKDDSEKGACVALIQVRVGPCASGADTAQA